MVVKRKSRRKIRKSRTGVSKRNSKRRVSKKKGSYRRRSRKKSKQKKSVRSRSKKKLKGVSRVRRSKGSKPVPFAMRGGAAKYIDNIINKKTLTKLIEDAPEDCQKSIRSIINEAEERTAEVLEAMTSEDAQALLAGRDKRNTIHTDTLAELIASRWARKEGTEKCKESMTLIEEASQQVDRVVHRVNAARQQPHPRFAAITVPQGVGPGRVLEVNNPYNQGQTFHVQVPAGHNAGAVFHVQI